MRFRNRRNRRARGAQSNGGVTSLTSLGEGEKGIVTKAMGGFGLVRRLTEMGITPGIEIRVLRKCAFHGPVELEVRGVALALGYGVASKVFVTPLKDEADA
ncbi:MAG: ferrous iron transport protein A [Candidatus Bathyarchaeota archaeon]|nr:ferrous iron transport protein A [Candidatus Bathyarchaeota archaeon]MDH5787963.1 ferrous iron transport protein A [Candidatus Bathyarchaeota archaeon]